MTNCSLKAPARLGRWTTLGCLGAGIAWLAIFAVRPAPADPNDAPSPNRFMRLARDEGGQPLALEVSIVQYVPTGDRSPGLTVDLVSAVHVGEKAYYEALNEQFKQYDALLYELVAPEGTRVPKGGAGGGGSPVSMLQVAMKNVLELSFQLDDVDYHPKNFVHADMSPEEFSRSMEKRGESLWTILSRAMEEAVAREQKRQEGKSTTMKMLSALRSKDRVSKLKDAVKEGISPLTQMFSKTRALALKRSMAEQVESFETMTIFDGPGGSTIVTERNKKALAVLKRQIAAGKKRIGIFYGAAHMPDMEKRLLADFGLQRGETRWLTAWDLRDPPKDKPKADPKVEEPAEAVPAASP